MATLSKTSHNEHCEIREELDEFTVTGFKMENVTKQFNKRKRAVDNLSFVAPMNQITVLLGHNGAGKSTAMNMLSGSLSPNQGNCFIGDKNVKDLR